MEARIEIEEATPLALFEAMWPLTHQARIRKDRYVVAHGPHRWEIDVFLDRDLVLAEVELDEVHEVAEFPAWLAPFVERDVTTDPAYLNSELARIDPAADE
jgi:CYTH domain-containing protein